MTLPARLIQAFARNGFVQFCCRFFVLISPSFHTGFPNASQSSDSLSKLHFCTRKNSYDGRHDSDSMIQATVTETSGQIETLLNHIHERTFGRLHELNVVPLRDGRLQVSAIAHSRFVGQLAEWAVLERLAPENVDLSICVRLSSPNLREVPK